MIFESLQSGLIRSKFDSLSSNIQKILEFNLAIDLKTYLNFLKTFLPSKKGYLEDIYYSGRPDFRETYYERSDILF